MKKFSDIKVGDSLFYVNVGKSLFVEKDEYGNIYKDGTIDGRYEIITIFKEGNTIHFNPVFEYGKIKASLISFSIDGSFEQSSIETKQKSFPYEHRVYMADESECSRLQREAALSEIKKQQQSIVSHQASCLERIESIRERYYKVLNPVSCALNKEVKQ